MTLWPHPLGQSRPQQRSRSALRPSRLHSVCHQHPNYPVILFFSLQSVLFSWLIFLCIGQLFYFYPIFYFHFIFGPLDPCQGHCTTIGPVPNQQTRQGGRRLSYTGRFQSRRILVLQVRSTTVVGPFLFTGDDGGALSALACLGIGLASQYVW